MRHEAPRHLEVKLRPITKTLIIITLTIIGWVVAYEAIRLLLKLF